MQQSPFGPGGPSANPQNLLYPGVRNNTDRGRIVLIIFYVLMGVAAIGFLIFLYGLMTDVIANGYELGNADNRDAVIFGIMVSLHALLNLIVTILTMVFFILWFRRAYFNLHAINYSPLRFTEGWAAGAWFVPFVNLAWPYQIMCDIWYGLQHAGNAKTGLNREIVPAGLVGWWWGIYLTNNIAANVISRMDTENMVKAEVYFGYPIGFFAIYLTIQLIRKTREFEKDFLREYLPFGAII